MIKPTIGRKVWFYDEPNTPEQDGTIFNVIDDHNIGVRVTNRTGNVYSRDLVLLVQDGETPPNGPHCRWMPYQVGQAKRHEPEQAKPDPAS